MARARNIKPGFFKNELLAEISTAGRLFFEGLWCLADREGRVEDRPRRLWAEVMPYDAFEGEAVMDQLAERGFIIRYEVDGAKYAQIVNFLKHQTPHCKEKPSVIPGIPGVEPVKAPGKHSASTRQAQCKPDECTEQAPSRFPDSLIPGKNPPNPPSGGRVSDSGKRAKPRAKSYPADFEAAFAACPKRAGGNSKSDAFTAWQARVRAGVDPGELVAGASRYAQHVRAEGKEGSRYVMQAATFFGPGDHYAEPWASDGEDFEGFV